MPKFSERYVDGDLVMGHEMEFSPEFYISNFQNLLIWNYYIHCNQTSVNAPYDILNNLFVGIVYRLIHVQ